LGFVVSAIVAEEAEAEAEAIKEEEIDRLIYVGRRNCFLDARISIFSEVICAVKYSIQY